MSRSGYYDDIDDNWAWIRWRGYVASAIRGKRGQSFLREMLAAMDAMPEKKLIANDLEVADGCVCAIGSVGKARGIDMSALDPENYDAVAATFGINEKLAQEIVFMNDEAFIFETDAKGYIKHDENGKSIYLTPEGRFKKMRAWIVSHIREAQP